MTASDKPTSENISSDALPPFYVHDGGVYCRACDALVSWEECDICGGDGFCLDESDPVNEPLGETVDCSQCDSLGGWRYCGACRAKAMKAGGP